MIRGQDVVPDVVRIKFAWVTETVMSRSQRSHEAHPLVQASDSVRPQLPLEQPSHRANAWRVYRTLGQSVPVGMNATRSDARRETARQTAKQTDETIDS